MYLTAEMVEKIDTDLANYTNEEVEIYYITYTGLYKHYPNNYYKLMIDRCTEELKKRGLGS